MPKPEASNADTAGGLFDLAYQAEAYINSTTRKQSKKIRESLNELNVAASSLYIGSAVNLTGLMVWTSPDDSRSNPANVETHLGYESFNGAACGFIVLDLENDFEPLQRNFDTDELELLEVLREQAAGRFAVSHLVNIIQGNWAPRPYLTSTTVSYNAAGPISSNQLFLDSKPDQIPIDERHKEVSRILDILPDSQKRLLTHVCTSFIESDTPLESLARSGRKLRELFTNSNDIDRLALMHVLDFHVRMVLGDKLFKFENGLPISMQPTGVNEADFYSFRADTPVWLRVEGITHAQRYLDIETTKPALTDERSLFLRTTIRQESGQTDTLLVPVEYLDRYSHTELTDE